MKAPESTPRAVQNPPVRLLTNAGGQIKLGDATLDKFRAGVRGAVLSAGDADYDEVRKVWNGMIDKRPALIVRCRGAADVVDAVNFARTHDILISIRGGGHNVAGSATCDEGMMIDLSLMRGVRVDARARTARVQGGATWGDVDRETQLLGLAVPAGVVSTTGVAGLTLGGGIGWLTRRAGLTIDNLVSVDIVTADGRLLVASETENSDLFWGLRGGGGNFGVVTSFEFRLHAVGPMVMACAPFYPVEIAGEVARAWRDFMAGAPEQLASGLTFWSFPADPRLPKEHHGRPVVIPNAVYSGAVEDGQRIIEPLRRLGTPLVDLSGAMPWTVLQSMYDHFFPQAALQYYWKSLYLEELSDEAIDHIVEHARSRPSPDTMILVLRLGGAMSRVKPDATAFGRRDMRYMVEMDSSWVEPQDAQRNISWTRKFWQDSQKYSTGSFYLNFPGLGEDGGGKLVRAAVGSANYARLVELKNRYDPGNLFRTNLNIEPTA